MDPFLIECMQVIDGLRAIGLSEPTPETIIQTLNDKRRVDGQPALSAREIDRLVRSVSSGFA